MGNTSNRNSDTHFYTLSEKNRHAEDYETKGSTISADHFPAAQFVKMLSLNQNTAKTYQI